MPTIVALEDIFTNSGDIILLVWVFEGIVEVDSVFRYTATSKTISSDIDRNTQFSIDKKHLLDEFEIEFGIISIYKHAQLPFLSSGWSGLLRCNSQIGSEKLASLINEPEYRWPPPTRQASQEFPTTRRQILLFDSKATASEYILHNLPSIPKDAPQ